MSTPSTAAMLDAVARRLGTIGGGIAKYGDTGGFVHACDVQLLLADLDGCAIAIRAVIDRLGTLSTVPRSTNANTTTGRN